MDEFGKFYTQTELGKQITEAAKQAWIEKESSLLERELAIIHDDIIDTVNDMPLVQRSIFKLALRLSGFVFEKMLDE